MKKFGFRTILSLILALTFVIVPFGNVIAAPPEKSWIHITSIGEDNITFDYGWNKVGVYAYRVYVVEGVAWYYNSGLVYMGNTTRSFEETLSVTHTGIDSGDNNIYVRLWLYDKNLRMIKRARIDMLVEVP